MLNPPTPTRIRPQSRNSDEINFILLPGKLKANKSFAPHSVIFPGVFRVRPSGRRQMWMVAGGWTTQTGCLDGSCYQGEEGLS